MVMSSQAMTLFFPEAKYPKAADCLRKDRKTLLAFYQFPAEHWQPSRTTNPIESTFATVRLRTAKTRGCLSRSTALTMAFQLARCAEKTWRRVRGYKRLAEIIEGVPFVDGEKDTRKAASSWHTQHLTIGSTL